MFQIVYYLFAKNQQKIFNNTKISNYFLRILLSKLFNIFRL